MTIKLTARHCALNLLARREYSQCELENKLLTKNFDAQEVAKVIDQLKTQNLQSDQRFSEAYVAMRMNRGFGPLRIREELKERGVAEYLIEAYILEEADIWQQKLVEVWEKKFRGQKPKDFAEKAKQMNFLRYRGFSHRQINQLLNE